MLYLYLFLIIFVIYLIRYINKFITTNKTELKLILNRAEYIKEFDSYDSQGINLSYSQILPFGTLKLRSTYLENNYDEIESFVSPTIIRKDESLVTSLSLDGQLNKIIPVIKDNSIFYTLNVRQSDVSSNILNHDIRRVYKTIGFTKRINLNE